MTTHLWGYLNTCLRCGVSRDAVDDNLAPVECPNAPVVPQYDSAAIKAALLKQAPWYGIDPHRSMWAHQLGMFMDVAKFESPEAFAAALVAAVEKTAAYTFRERP